MPAIPVESDFTGSTRTNAQMKVTHAALRSYLVGLLGADGLAPTALAALGVTAAAGHLTRTSATTLTAADRGRVVSATSGTWALTLPDAATAGVGWTVLVRNTGTGVVTLTRAGSDLIDGAATVALAGGLSALVLGTGTGFLTVALGATAGGATLAADGSAAAPGLGFAADPDTGFYRPGTNQIGLSTGGVARALLTTTALQLDVALTGTAVTASATDVAAGRVLRVGASPLQLSASAALRVTVGGTVNARTLTSGASFASIPTGLMLRFRAPGANTAATTINLDGLGAQACVTVTGAALPSGYIRTDVDTVAVWDGTNWVVDREVQRIENANGIATRWSDGRQICHHTIAAGSGIAVGAGTLASPYGTSAFSWTFPSAFSAAPAVAGTVGFDGATLDNRSFTLAIRTATTTAASNMNAVRLTSSAVDVSVTARVIASGVWY